jgi:hypothetical protein
MSNIIISPTFSEFKPGEPSAYILAKHAIRLNGDTSVDFSGKYGYYDRTERRMINGYVTRVKSQLEVILDDYKGTTYSFEVFDV